MLTQNGGRSIWQLARGPVVAWLMVLIPAASAGTASSGLAKDKIVGGEHWRVRTSRGPIHVWCPALYDRHTAGTVIYVHGYAVDADGAWERHQLAKQFQASRRNAIFLVPEAPASPEDTVRFPSLNELLSAAGASLHRTWPPGPVVIVGHSGAHRTLVPWLKNPRVSHVILLDAVYGGETVTAVRDWFRTSRGRLIVVAADTAEESERLIQGLPSATRRAAIPESAAAFTPGERQARVAYLRSQYSHLEIVTEGKTIAPLLGLTRLPRIGSAPRPAAPARPRK
jgi:hypothetical protein